MKNKEEKRQMISNVYSHYGNYTKFNKVVRHAFANNIDDEYGVLHRVWNCKDKVFMRRCHPYEYEFVQSVKDSLNFRYFWRRAKECSESKEAIAGYSIASWKYKGWHGYIMLSFRLNGAKRWAPVFTYSVDIPYTLKFEDDTLNNEGFTNPKDLLKWVDNQDFVIVEKPYNIRKSYMDKCPGNIMDIEEEEKQFYILMKDIETFDAIYDGIMTGKATKIGNDA